MNIGQAIREIRIAHKATLEEIAFAADTNASNLSRIERGTQGYSADTLERIAKALGVTVSELHLRMEAASRSVNKAGRAIGGQKQPLLGPHDHIQQLFSVDARSSGTGGRIHDHVAAATTCQKSIGSVSQRVNAYSCAGLCAPTIFVLPSSGFAIPETSNRRRNVTLSSGLANTASLNA